jgi:hypothetical protein
LASPLLVSAADDTALIFNACKWRGYRYLYNSPLQAGGLSINRVAMNVTLAASAGGLTAVVIKDLRRGEAVQHHMLKHVVLRCGMAACIGCCVRVPAALMCTYMLCFMDVWGHEFAVMHSQFSPPMCNMAQ